MRPGLFAVGVVLLILGGLAAFLVVPLFETAGNPEVTTGGLGPPSPQILSGGALLVSVSGINTTDGMFSMSWQASLPVNVTLYERADCSGSDTACILTHPTVHWPANASGSYAAAGSLGYPYLLQFENPNKALVAVQASWTTSIAGPPTSFLTAVVLLTTAVILATIGGLALFLGLFLRGGVYSGRRPPLVSQSADDVDDLDTGPAEDVDLEGK